MVSGIYFNHLIVIVEYPNGIEKKAIIFKFTTRKYKTGSKNAIYIYTKRK